MAGRVNTKFVITLSAALVLVFGGLLGAALWIKLHNAPDLAKKGDARMETGRALLASGKSEDAQKEFEAAEKLYSKAVYKEQMNPFYVEKWLESLRMWVPETQSRSVDAFRARIIPALRMVAAAKKTDVGAHREYLELLYRLNKMAPSRSGAESFISEIDRTLLFFRGDPKENSEAQVLRRYRGLIVKNMMQGAGMELQAEQMDRALEDLKAAYAADPSDTESAIAIADWYDARSRIARTNNKSKEEIDALEGKALDTIAQLAKEHPDDLLVAVRAVLASMYIEMKAIRESQKSTQEALAADRALAGKLSNEFKHICALVEARGGDLTTDELAQFQQLEVFFEPDGAFKRSTTALRQMIAAHPDAPEAYSSLAQLRAAQEDIAEATSLLQKVVDMPPKPAGLDALRLYDLKGRARFFQSLYAFQEWDASNQDPAKAEQGKKALAESRRYRADMEQYVGSDSELLRFMDGLHRFAEGDWLGSKKLLTEYIRRIEGLDIRAEWTLAQCEIRLRNMGAALEILNRLVGQRPDIPGPVVTRAALLNDLGRQEDAIRSLEDFLRNQPDNKPAQDALQRIRIASGKDVPSDPVEAARVEAIRLMVGTGAQPADPGAAEERIERAIKESTDPRLAEMLASIRLGRGDLDGAIAALEGALASNPKDEGLARTLAGLKSDDPVAWSAEQIDASKELSDLEKLLRKNELWLRAADNAQATADTEKATKWRADADGALDAALKLAPDDQRVVDRVFTRALAKRDWALAERMVEQAAVKDYDRVGGAMYKGRLLYARGQLAEAAGVLREAADKKIADVASLRLLALIYQQLSRTEDAETYFKAAIALRPSDATTQVLYLTLLRSTGREIEALAKAKEAEPACRTSTEFMSLLLSLESAVGKPEDALARREEIYKRDPRNVANTLALASLYLDAKRWKDARDTLDALRKIGDGTDYALADARYYADQGDFSGAMKAMTDFIARQDAKQLSVDTFVALGRFLIDRKRFPEGIEMMQRGEAFQNPKVMEADRAIAETLIAIGQPDVAIPALKAIVDAGADGERQEVRIRMAEIMTSEAARTASVDMYRQADEQLGQIKTPADGAAQMQLMLVRADVAHGLSDDKKAVELYNQAIAQFPTEPMVYLRRAQFYLTRGETGAKDALQDLDAALRVRPTFWQALQLRSFVYLGLGGEENRAKGLADVKETLRINPSLDDLRVKLLNELIRSDRSAEAAEIADSAARTRPNDVALVMTMGQVFAQSGDWNRATEYYRLGWVRCARSRPDVAQTLLNAMLNSRDPNLSEAESVLREVQQIEVRDTKGAKVDAIMSNWGLLLARAKLAVKRGRAPDAVRDVMVSMAVISSKPTQPPTAEQIGQWSSEVRQMFPRTADVVALLERRDVPATFGEWAKFLRAQILLESPETRPQAAVILDEILAQVTTPDVRKLAFRLRGNINYFDKKYDAAEAVWRKGVTEFPEDWELNNNLAYCLAKFLNRAKDALPFAEATARFAPALPEAVDTYGYVLMLNGDYPAAENQFKRALALVRNESTHASVLLHLARCYVEQNKAADARVHIDAVRKMMDRDGKIESENQAEYEELKQRVGSP